MGQIILIPLRLISWIYYVQPFVLRRYWGVLLGVMLRLIGLRSHVVMENLKIAFPQDDEQTRLRRKQLFRAAYEHLGHVVFEILLLFGPMRRFVLNFSDLRGLEYWQAAKRRGKGVLFLASHVGNWEVMAASGALSGIDLMIVTKHLKPEWLHRAIEVGRLKCSVRATYEPRTFRDVLSHLKQNGTVGFVLDQYAGPPIGIRVPVFGVPVSTSSVVAMLAKRTGAQVLPVVNYRSSYGRWIIKIQEPMVWKTSDNSALELAQNTAAYTRSIEEQIISHPEQWLWIHRRFKGDLSPLREGEWSDGRKRHY
jgi:Kdo2-lipid IVA lauroyltransferase/acyltransferase